MDALKPNLYDKNLEGLRGLCALMVVMSHLLGFGFFGTKDNSLISVLLHLQFARMAVLIFFIISGYVMGISHIHTLFDYGNVTAYLKKRLIRLYPIYLFALLICVIFGYWLVSLTQVIGHVFFLQEFAVKTLQTNPPLWSLSFECVYYLLFLGLWSVNTGSRNWYLVLSVIIVCVCLTGHNNNNSLRALFIGWVFWLSGLYIARLSKNDLNLKGIVKPFYSYIFLLLSTADLQTGGFMMRLLHISFNDSAHVSIDDLIYLPVCILLVLNTTERYFKYIFWIELVAYVLPALNIGGLFYFKHDILSKENWIYGIVFFCMSILFLPLKLNNGIFGKLASIGKISFAIYVFHFPISYFLNLYLGRILSGLLFTLVGISTTIIITYALSYLAEVIIQPKIRRFFLKTKTQSLSQV